MKRKTLVAVVLLLGILFVPFVFSSGVGNVVYLPLFGGFFQPLQGSTTEVLVDPDVVIEDYAVLPVGSSFSVDVNVSDVTDLFTWQVNMTWDSSVLNLTSVVYGDFLRATVSPNGTSAWINRGVEPGVTFLDASNESGYGAVAETVLGDYAGVTGSGHLVSYEFQVVGYGATNLALSSLGVLPTTLLNSAGAAIAFTSVNGYFRNALLGDANLDKIVDVFDVLNVKFHRSGPPPGPGGYLREADINDDGSIDVFDILIVKANLGRSVP